MTCPECGCTIMYCESVYERGNSTLRIRVCAECEHREFTEEEPIDFADGENMVKQYQEEHSGMHN